MGNIILYLKFIFKKITMKFYALAALCLGASAVKLEQKAPPCVYLDETQAELDKQTDLFSKTLDTRHWTNVLNIAGAIKKKSGVAPKLQVHTWELLDKAFTSQELEDTHTSKKTWTCSSTSKITLTPILATQSTWPTSSRLPTPSRRTSTPNTTTVNSLTQPSMHTRRKTELLNEPAETGSKGFNKNGTFLN